MLVMKRVVGLPKEQVQIFPGGKILINGREASPPAPLKLQPMPYGNVIAGQIAECGIGYYVLGDYTKDSDDSRFNGPLTTDSIVGRAWLILAPSGRRGWVHSGH